MYVSNSICYDCIIMIEQFLITVLSVILTAVVLAVIMGGSAALFYLIIVKERPFIGIPLMILYFSVLITIGEYFKQ